MINLNKLILNFNNLFIIFLNIIFFYEISETVKWDSSKITLEFVSTIDIVSNDIYFEILDPSELQYTYRLRPARDFGTSFNDSNKLEEVGLVPMEPLNGCEVPSNIDYIEGNIAFAQRGECSFKRKAKIAEESGALGIIITDENLEDEEIEMMDDNSIYEVNIPAAFLVGKNGYIIRTTLEKLNKKYAIINLPVNLTFTPLHEMNQPPWLLW